MASSEPDAAAASTERAQAAQPAPEAAAAPAVPALSSSTTRKAEVDAAENAPNKKIRSALQTMMDASETGASLPTSDLDSHQNLVDAWMQYRDSYGSNSLASGGGVKLTAAMDSPEAAEAEATAGGERPTTVGGGTGAEDEATAVAAAAAGAGRCDIAMWAP